MVLKEAAKAPSKLKYRMTAKLKTKSERKNVCHTASNLSIKIFSFSPLEAIFRRFIDSHRSWFGLFFVVAGGGCCRLVAIRAKCLCRSCVQIIASTDEWNSFSFTNRWFPCKLRRDFLFVSL